MGWVLGNQQNIRERHVYARTSQCGEITDCSESGTWNLLVVRVRAIKLSTIL